MKTELVMKYVDNSLDHLRSVGLMSRPHSNMPVEMVDSTREIRNDWIPWKAVSSIVTDSEIFDLEQKINLTYPDLYKFFLKYKHFYELDNVLEINFYKHCIRDWKEELLKLYYEYDVPEVIIMKGYIPFADFSDWGIVCFDTSRMENGDCPIVMFDHDVLLNETVEYEQLFGSFEQMIQELVRKQEE